MRWLRCVVATGAPFSSAPLTHRPQLLSLTSPYNGGLLPLSFGLFHQQEVVRDLTVDLFTQLRMFPVSLSIITFYFCPAQPLNLDVLHAGWRAVFTSAKSFSTLRLCSTSSRARVARQQQRARPLWRWPFSATYQLFEDPFPQERTQLGCGVMKFSLTRTQLLYSSCIIILWAAAG
jgi:hypothetical protein